MKPKTLFFFFSTSVPPVSYKALTSSSLIQSEIWRSSLVPSLPPYSLCNPSTKPCGLSFEGGKEEGCMCVCVSQ